MFQELQLWEREKACKKSLVPPDRQELAAARVEEIEAEAAERRERTGAQALGPTAILAQSPKSRPVKTKRSPALNSSGGTSSGRHLFRAETEALASRRKPPATATPSTYDNRARRRLYPLPAPNLLTRFRSVRVLRKNGGRGDASSNKSSPEAL
jgi:hypothetical protein